MLSGRRLGWTLAILATVLYSTNAPIARGIILAGMKPTTIVVGRFTVSAIVFGLLLAFTSLGIPGQDEKPLDRRHFLICIISGSFSGLMLVFFYTALVSMTASVGHLLGVALFPLATLMILALRGEKLTGWKIARLGIAIVGLYFLLDISGRPSLNGLFYVILAAIAYGIHLATVQWYLRPFNTWLITGIMMTAAAVVVIIYWRLADGDTYVAGWQGWAAMAYQGIVLTVIGRVTIYKCIGLIGSGELAMLNPVEALLTIIWSILFLQESLLAAQILGALFILLSAAMAADITNFRRKTPVPDSG